MYNLLLMATELINAGWDSYVVHGMNSDALILIHELQMGF